MNWPERTLGDVCEVNPRLPRDHGLGDDTSVSFVPMAAVDEVSGVVRDKQQRPFLQVKKGYTSFRDGDVLFAKITPCMENGKAAVASDLLNGVGFGSTEFHVLRPKAGVLAEWIYYFVRRDTFRREAKRNFTGTAGQQRVPTTFLAQCRIHVPPFDEQRRIVDLLSRAEGVVRLRREAQKKAAEIIPALFLDMFGDPVSNVRGWATMRLGNVVEFRSGGTPSKARDDFWNGDLPWVSPKDMKIAILKDATDHVSRTVLTQTNLKLVPSGAVLIVVRGMILAHTVPVALAAAPLTINQDMKALLPGEALEGTYLLWALKVLHPSLLAMVSTAAHGTKKLDTERLESLPIPLPPLNLQLEFNSRVVSFFSVLAQQSIALEKAEAIFQALLSRAFSGDAATQASANETAVA